MTGVGKPFFNGVSEAARASQIVRELGVSRTSATTEATTADDFYSVVETSYDADLKNKGVCSSTPVTLCVVPFTKLTETDNAQADILNIQRNLDTIATSNVNEIINYVTASFTEDENLALEDRSQIDTFRSTVNKLTAAYNAKAAYMTHLADTYGLETDSDFNNSYGTGTSVPTAITTIKITSLEKKSDWVESYLKVGNRLNDSYNIERLLQIVRNSFARKEYGDNFTIAGDSTSLYVNPIDVDTFKTAATEYFGDLTNTESDANLTWDDEITSALVVSDSKSVGYTRAGVSPDAIVNSLIGQLSLYSVGLNLTSNSSLGIFSNLTKYTDGTKAVLPLDVNLGSQTSLQTYETADEYFLGLPLNINKEDLKTRSAKFSTDARSIEADLKDSIGRITLSSDKDLYCWNAFLSQMRSMIEKSFYTTNDVVSIHRFSLLTVSLQNSTARKIIFKIMMLRDRLRNASDYVETSQVSRFKTKVTSELENEILKLINALGISSIITPDDEDAYTKYDKQNALNEEISEIINNQFGKIAATTIYTTPTVYTSQDPLSMIQQLVTDLNDPSEHQWDNFFIASKNVEQGVNTFTRTSWSSGASATAASCGISNSLLQLNRDKRAFLFFNKWMTIINDFPFALEILKEGQSSSVLTTTEEYGSDQGATSLVDKYTLISVYSQNMYAELKSALTLTLSSSYTADQFSYYFEYVQPVAREILQDTQTFYDGIDYVYRYIMQASSLLTTAADLAYAYTPVYGEKLSNHYTSNSILNLNRQSRFAFSQNSTYKNFSQDQYKLTDTLNGFFRYVQDDSEVSTEEDSFVVVCGIPYGMLDRLGAFNQDKLGYVDVTVTIRSIDGNPDNDVKIVKSYPINAYVEHQRLSYNTTTNASYSQVLEATSLYELSPQNTFVTIDEYDEQTKKNELQSTALLNYIQLFYGLTLGPYITPQVVLPEITDQNILNARDKLEEEVYSYRFDELVETRYVSTGIYSLKFTKGDIITQALGGCVFDKVVAIPVDATLLKVASEQAASRTIVEAGSLRSTLGSTLRQDVINIIDKKSGYLADVLVSIETRFVDRARTTTGTTRSASSLGDTSTLITTLQNSIRSSAAAPISSTLPAFGRT